MRRYTQNETGGFGNGPNELEGLSNYQHHIAIGNSDARKNSSRLFTRENNVELFQN